MTDQRELTGERLLNLLASMVDGQRLEDIADLQLDLAVQPQG